MQDGQGVPCLCFSKSYIHGCKETSIITHLNHRFGYNDQRMIKRGELQVVTEKRLAAELIDFIDRSPTAFHAVSEMEAVLKNNGFKKLHLRDKWDLKQRGKYYVTANSSACIAFVIGEGSIAESGFKIIGAHTDSPTFCIKPYPEMSADGYLKLNTEIYGGPIINTWLDRPLSLAGRITVRSNNPLWPESKLVNIKGPLLVIPNLAVHLNRSVNDGIKLNAQKDTLPIIRLINDQLTPQNYLLKLLAREADLPEEDILDFDLFLYEHQKGSIIGSDQQLISASRIDDLAMVHAGLKALCGAKPKSGVNVLACFDNEEVGSSSKQGADSPLLATVLERIVLAENKNKIVLSSKHREDYFRAVANSFFISADMAHAVHPNSPERHDPVNKPRINCGPVIKINANQRYTSDSDSTAVFASICRENNIPYQTFVNRSDLRGGSTIGPITARHLNIRSVDIGNPMLAMHSIRELAGVKDHLYVYQAFVAFYSM